MKKKAIKKKPRKPRVKVKKLIGWKAPQDFKDYLWQLFNKFRSEMWLGEYELGIASYQHIPMPDYKDGASMEVEIDNAYLTILVKISKKVYPFWLRKNYRTIARMVIHELAHAHTDPLVTMLYENTDKKLHKEVRRTCERQTERIANSIYSFVRREDYWPTKPRK